jgi:hypothetical protein
MADDWTHEETDSVDFADARNFYKVEKWPKDGSKVDRLLFELRIYCNPVFPFRLRRIEK